MLVTEQMLLVLLVCAIDNIRNVALNQRWPAEMAIAALQGKKRTPPIPLTFCNVDEERKIEPESEHGGNCAGAGGIGGMMLKLGIFLGQERATALLGLLCLTNSD